MHENEKKKPRQTVDESAVFMQLYSVYAVFAPIYRYYNKISFSKILKKRKIFFCIEKNAYRTFKELKKKNNYTCNSYNFFFYNIYILKSF